MPSLNRIFVRKWVQEPRFQEAATHGGSAAVERGKQTTVILSRQRRCQFQISQCCLVQQQVALFLNEFNVLQGHIRTQVYRCKVVCSQSRGRDGERGVVQVKVA